VLAGLETVVHYDRDRAWLAQESTGCERREGSAAEGGGCMQEGACGRRAVAPVKIDPPHSFPTFSPREVCAREDEVRRGGAGGGGGGRGGGGGGGGGGDTGWLRRGFSWGVTYHCVCLCVSISPDLRARACICVHACIHACMHAYARAHTRARTSARGRGWPERVARMANARGYTWTDTRPTAVCGCDRADFSRVFVGHCPCKARAVARVRAFVLVCVRLGQFFSQILRLCGSTWWLRWIPCVSRMRTARLVDYGKRPAITDRPPKSL
jgi:hypothetical protein